VFETVMRVRHTEIDLGQHVTIESLTALLSEARLRFLHAKGIKEINLEKEEIREMSISGVPTFILNKNYLLQGAQDSTTMVPFFRRILEKDNLKN
ncbi:MAG: hypothetical protein VYC46_05300, partial [Pseudomonadota bacterium]|nr:hypothetical protein [Pseudomonadota bacterium]